MDSRRYYEAYDDRYRQVHEQNLQWFSGLPSPIVEEVMDRFGVQPHCRILEIGCGEGRDAGHLLKQGYDVLATDIAPNAVSFCRKQFPQWAEHFQILDCINGRLPGKFDFIYAVAVLHMLVEDRDRDGFYQFLREQLTENGIALVCTMGDGTFEVKSDISAAFTLQERTHQASGQTLSIAGTSCRVVRFEEFRRELAKNGLAILKEGITSVEPDFPTMMYAVVKPV